jgi:hypothetical protein
MEYTGAHPHVRGCCIDVVQESNPFGIGTV